MATGAAAPEVGQIVSVRNRSWVVSGLNQSSLPPVVGGQLQSAQHVVDLVSVEDDGHGQTLKVVWELEPGAHAPERGTLPEPRGFDEPATLDAFLDAVRWGAIATADTKRLQSPFRAGIQIEDYQLDPVARAVDMPRVSLLIADDVGLGKTIEAGLVALELILRHRARNILIVCPSSLQIQWQEQMQDKFGLEFRIVNRQLLGELRRSRGIHANPWTHFPYLITSIDYLKRDRPMRLMRDVLPGASEPRYPRKFDLLIVDEAHNVAPSGTGRYATESDRTRAIRELVPHFEHKLFLTATPHNGYSESFSALLELLDDQRFARAVPPDGRQLAEVMVRRLKSELQDLEGNRRFAPRVLKHLAVQYSPEERRGHDLLTRYAQLRRKQAGSEAERVASEFVLKVLKKRLFSSPAAFARTIEPHAETMTRPKAREQMPTPSAGVLKQRLDAAFDALEDDDLEPQAKKTQTTLLGTDSGDDGSGYGEMEQDAFGTTARVLRLGPDELAVLKDLRAWADRAGGSPDSKARRLLAWLNDTIRPRGRWGDERVIIFTEYRDTQRWLHDHVLAPAGLTGEGRTLQISGGMDPKDREAVKAAFQAHPASSPVRILLATDAASEGLDLQNHCHQLIHYEIPWNPNRLEQRNGRVDRHGQKASEVLIYHFVGKGFDERSVVNKRPGDLEGDLEFLVRAAVKVNQIRSDLGSVGTVLAEAVESAMLGRPAPLAGDAQLRGGERPSLARRQLQADRSIAQRVQAAKEVLDATRTGLSLTPDRITAAVQVALRISNQPCLQPTTITGSAGRPLSAWVVPPFSGSWAECNRGLEHPFTGKPRPIVFDESAARGRDDVVLAHLNHTLVQRCLRVLRAAIWGGETGLNRVTARVVPDGTSPAIAVIAHARLVVTGGDGDRLHEELISAGGYLRNGRFARFPSIREMDGLIEQATDRPIGAGLQEQLRQIWPTHRDPLVQALEARQRERTNGLQTIVRAREQADLDAITQILGELERAIRAELHEPEVQQLEFNLFSADEKSQYERDRDALRRRLVAIPAELAAERAAIARRYERTEPRLFPVAVTYLVPESIATNGVR